MKRAILVLVAACSVIAAAEEPEPPAAPPATDPAGQLQVKPDMKMPIFFRSPGSTCYFIRTLRPLPEDAGASKSGFIPVQARITGIVHGPDCTNGGKQVPLVPVVKKVTAPPADGASP